MFTAYDTYLTNNGNDVTWANTVAAAFEAVGGEDGISTVSDAALQACLEAAGVSVSRTQITIEPASVQGGQVTADRLRGDVEALGELDDEDAPSTTHLLHDLAVPVLDAHVHPLTPVSTTDHVRSGIISILNV